MGRDVGTDTGWTNETEAGMGDGAGEARQTVVACVWDALEDTPEAAVLMRLRSDLMTAVL